MHLLTTLYLQKTDIKRLEKSLNVVIVQSIFSSAKMKMYHEKLSENPADASSTLRVRIFYSY